MSLVERIFTMGAQVQDNEKWRALMAAIDDLEGQVVALQSVVGRVEARVEELKAAQVDEARVQAATDAVAQQVVRLDGIVAP